MLKACSFSWLVVLGLACAPALATEAPAARSPTPPRICLTAAQAREAIEEHQLADSIGVMRNAAAQARSEALAAKLCRWNDEFVYEITLLRRDGHVSHVFMNASDGKAVGQR